MESQEHCNSPLRTEGSGWMPLCVCVCVCVCVYVCVCGNGGVVRDGAMCQANPLQLQSQLGL